MTFLFVLFLPLTAQAQDISSGLIGHWKLDEESGTTAADSAGTYDGTMGGGLSAATDSVQGKVGQALTFDGVGDYVEVADHDDLTFANAITIALWINVDTLPDDGPWPLVKKRRSASDSYQLNIFGNDTIEWMIDTGTAQQSFSTTTVSGRGWTHVVGTWDGNDMSVYIDGVLEDTDPKTGSMANTPNSLVFGYGSDVASIFDPYSGTMDDIRIYSRALTPDDVAELAATTFPGKLRFNTGHRTLEYYDSTEWVGVNRTGSPTADGLVGHWRLDEESGTTAVDSAGSNNGTMQGGLSAGTDTVTGQTGGALDLDGTDDYIEIPNDASLEPSDEITVSAWVFWTDTVDDYQKIFALSKNDTGPPYQSYALGANNGSGLLFEVNINGTLRVSGGYAVPTGQWIHVTGQWKSGETIKLFVDGALAAESASAYTGTIPYYGMPAAIGRSSNAETNREWHGYIDDVRVYNRALSAAEIQSLYEYTRAPPLDENVGLVGHWKLDEDSGTIAQDSAGNNDGTMQGGLDAGTDSVAGQIGTALSFDGTDDYIEIPNDASLEPSDEITVAAWVFWTDITDDWQKIFALSHTTDISPYQSYALGQDAGASEFLFEVNINGTLRESGGYAVPTGQWVHVAGQWRTGGDIKLFVDGVLVGSAGPYSGTISYYGMPAAIGRPSNNEANREWHGQIDDVRVYNRALSADEIQALYNGNASCSSPAGHSGKIVYNATHDVMQYCDGFDWVAMGPVPGAGGASCSSPSGSTGALIYNTTYNVIQYCDGTNWRLVGKDCPRIGDKCFDGSYYIGDSPADGARVYMTSVDHATQIRWDASACEDCGDGTLATNTQDGRVNVEAMRAYDGEAGTSAGTLDGFSAAKYCDDLAAHGKDDWYLVAGSGSNGSGSTSDTFEQNLFWIMVDSVGLVDGLEAGFNWSSTESGGGYARAQRLSDGYRNGYPKNGSRHVRCVRR